MAYKVGATVVIDDSGHVDWSRITNAPVIGSGDVTGVAVANGAPTSGYLIRTGSAQTTACTGNCYVESLSGGGAGGEITITANRKAFNCNCQCQCRC